MLLIGFVGTAATASSLTLTQIDPVSGPPGTVVTVSGVFDPDQDYSVEFGETSVATSAKTTSSITFSVPAGANTGNITIDDGTGPVVFPSPFVVLREITGRFVPPAGFDSAAYSAGTGEDVRDIEANGTFSALIEDGMPSAVIVFRGDTDPAFMAMVSSTETDIVVDASSTAEALVISNPLLQANTDSVIESLRSRLQAADDFASLVALIEQSAGKPFLNDARLDELLVSLILEMNTPPAALREPRDHLGEPFKGDDFVRTFDAELRDLNPDPAMTANPIFRHEPSLSGFVKDDPDDIDQLIFSFDRAMERSTPTRLDWALTVRELDPFLYPGGFEEIANLQGNDPLTAPVPLDSGFVDAGWVRAKLTFAKADLLGRAINAARDALIGGLEKEANPDGTADFEIPNTRNKMFMVTATSGNIWYGTDWFFNGDNNQDATIDASGTELQWTLSAAANVTVAATDAVSVFIAVPDIAGIGGGYITAAMKSVVKTLTAYRSSSDVFTEAAMYELVKNLATDLMNASANAAGKKLPDKAASFSSLAFQAANFVKKSIDILGKISSAGQAIERAATLFSPGTLAMERSILIVGDPFAPNITAVFPQEGRTGSEVTITGTNMVLPGTPPVVTFCQFPSSIERDTRPEPNPDVQPMVAEILSSSETSITVRVPEGFLERFGTAGAHICITKSEDVNSHSYSLGDAGKFNLIPPPEITGIDPPPEAGGGVVTLTGMNFNGLRPTVRLNVQPLVLGVSPLDNTRLTVMLPALPAKTRQGVPIDYTLIVSVADEESQPFVFQVEDPQHELTEGIVAGVNIPITSPTMNNAADDQISIKEAFLIATGGLGRGLSDDENELVPFWEQAGVNRIDTIIFGSALGPTIALSEALPAVGTGDRIVGGGVILDGAGAPAGSDGLILDGASDVSVQDLILQGWDGDGIRVTNESSGNTFDRITVKEVGGTGIFVANESNFNTFSNIEALDCGQDGISISGLCNHNDFESILVSRVGGNGVKLSDQTDHNRFLGTLTVSDCTLNWILLEADASANQFFGTVEVSGSGMSGIVISGSGSRYNGFYSGGSNGFYAYIPRLAVRDCKQYGVLVDNGASFNVIGNKFISNCDLGGVFLIGDGTKGNTLGRIYLRPPSFQINELVYGIIADNGVFDEGGAPLNAAPGIRLGDGAEQNTLTGLHVAGNSGDGIVLEGALCRLNSILSIRTGVQSYIENEAPIARPNRGSGIRIKDGAHSNIIAAKTDVFIGTFGGGNISFEMRNRIANELEHGIVFEEGAHSNVVMDTDVGGTARDDDGEGAVGRSGIVIQSGAHDNQIGPTDRNKRLFLNACPEGAIIIDGTESKNNVIVGVEIGTNAHRGVNSTLADERPNAAGIVIRNGANGNSVGIPGPMKNAPSRFGGGLSNTTVTIQNVTGAGITLDGSGGTAQANGSLESPNTIQSTTVSESGTALRITGSAKANVIGSKNPWDRNLLSAKAGSAAAIHIDGNVIDRPEMDRNRFYWNFTGVRASSDPNLDLFADPAANVSLLISNGSKGNIVGETTSLANTFTGILIDNSSGNWIRGNRISNYGVAALHSVGIVVRDSSDNLIGGAGQGWGNLVGDPNRGFPGPGGAKNAGIALVNGGNNTVQGNTIQAQPGHGILIENSASNLVGGALAVESNVITRNARSGVAISGHSSQNNAIQNNWIGTDTSGLEKGNKQHGIWIEGAAGGNWIGGLTDPSIGAPSFGRAVNLSGPAGNTIAFNAVDGVAVEGADTSGNPILYNSIYANQGSGIALISEGNSGLQVEASGTFGNGVATGTITNLGEVPPGSIIQLFGDTATQGEVYLGQTEVQAGGSWLAQSLPPHPFRNVTFTATTPDPSGFGDTSAFYTLAPEAEPRLHVARTAGGEPVSRVAAFVDGELPVLPITFTSEGGAAQVTSVTFRAGGTLDETQLHAVRLFLDTDGDGAITDRDEEIAEPQTFAGADGEAEFELSGLIVSAGVPVDAIVLYESQSAVAEGTTINLQITAAESVNARFILPPEEAVAANPFPVQSDDFTIGAVVTGITFGSWQSVFFPGENDPLIIGPNGDSDGDGVINLLEFFFGTDPTDRASAHHPDVYSANGSRGLEFTKARNLENVAMVIEASADMKGWTAASGDTLTTPINDQLERVTFNLSEAGAVRYLRIRITLLQL